MFIEFIIINIIFLVIFKLSIFSFRRLELAVENDCEMNWGSSLLFIDAFIEYECGGSNLRRYIKFTD